MTKDRRLGRGLAALLGSPLDEESVVDSVRGTTAGGTLPTQGDFTPTAAISNDTHSVQVATRTGSPQSNVPRPAASVARQSVTGAVPLSSLSNSNTVSPGSADYSTSATGRSAAKSTTDTNESKGSTTLQLSVYEIDNNPFQPRRKFNEEEIASLAASIREHEQLQPILVRRVGDRYQLISGERRLRAAIHAGLKSIRAEVREADDRLVAELAIVENLQRKDLDAIEKALSFRRYIDQHECSQEQLAKRLKIDRSTVTNMMRLLELPQEVQQWIQNESLTVGHAKALLSLGDERQQIEFGRLIQAETWSVRETERRVNAALANEDAEEASTEGVTAKPNRRRTSPQVAQLEQQMRLSLGTKTDIRQNASGSGKITITFANSAEFERLCSLICPEMAKQRAA